MTHQVGHTMRISCLIVGKRRKSASPEPGPTAPLRTRERDEDAPAAQPRARPHSPLPPLPQPAAPAVARRPDDTRQQPAAPVIPLTPAAEPKDDDDVTFAMRVPFGEVPSAYLIHLADKRFDIRELVMHIAANGWRNPLSNLPFSAAERYCIVQHPSGEGLALADEAFNPLQECTVIYLESVLMALEQDDDAPEYPDATAALSLFYEHYLELSERQRRLVDDLRGDRHTFTQLMAAGSHTGFNAARASVILGNMLANYHALAAFL